MNYIYILYIPIRLLEVKNFKLLKSSFLLTTYTTNIFTITITNKNFIINTYYKYFDLKIIVLLNVLVNIFYYTTIYEINTTSTKFY